MEDLEAKAILDTDVIIDYLKKRPNSLSIEIFKNIKDGRLSACTTSITIFELDRGARRAKNSQGKLQDLEVLLAYLPALPFDYKAARKASESSITGTGRSATGPSRSIHRSNYAYTQSCSRNEESGSLQEDSRSTASISF